MCSVIYQGVNGTTYGPTSTPPTLAGSYSVVATVIDANYSGSIEGTLTIRASDGPVFTDDPLQVRTAVKAVHITELRQVIDQLRSVHGLVAFNWTDQPLVPGVTLVRAAHLTELRTALAAVYTAMGQPPPSWLPPTITAGATVITAAQIAELRRAVVAIW